MSCRTAATLLLLALAACNQPKADTATKAPDHGRDAMPSTVSGGEGPSGVTDEEIDINATRNAVQVDR